MSDARTASGARVRVLRAMLRMRGALMMADY